MHLSPNQEATETVSDKDAWGKPAICTIAWQGCKAGLRITRLWPQEMEKEQAGLPTQYLFGDVTIFVNVIEIEGPLELLVDCPSK